ncbi:hypothetical protein [Rhabdothermincola sediminis]|uniref:hypothetical protein n=1 Tax=Rhabdothermincola sediminis TaxID=2751370 RepID=UPI001AA035FF|nr:hypothetical protein [Rhabdothermincola sediminis]
MRKLGALLLAGLFLAGLVGCSSKKSDTTTEAGGRETAGTSAETESAEGEGGSGDSSSGDSSSGGSASTDELDLSNLGGLGNCLEIGAAYASVHLNALGAGDEQTRAELQKALDDLEGELPDDIRDDLQVIADGISRSKNLVEVGEFFDSEEYTKANANIERYINEECGTSG